MSGAASSTRKQSWAYYCAAGCGARMATAHLDELPASPPAPTLFPATERKPDRRLERGYRQKSDGRYYRSGFIAKKSTSQRIRRLVQQHKRSQRSSAGSPVTLVAKNLFNPLPKRDDHGRELLLFGVYPTVVCAKCGAESVIGDAT